MKIEEIEEMNGRCVLPSMALRRRVSTMTYLVWLLVEGLLSIIHHVRMNESDVSGGESRLLYFVGAGLLIAFLQSYVGGSLAMYSFQLATLVHQISLIAIWLWKLSNPHEKGMTVWFGFRSAILLYCATGESGAAVLQIGQVLAHVLVPEKEVS